VGISQDGEFGASTERALKIRVTKVIGPRAAHGKVTPAVWTAIRAKAPASPAVAATLRPATPAVRGTHVRAIQGQLNVRLRELGSSTRVQITGAYGAQSQKAMREFQTRSKLPATAAVGPATLKALRTPTRAANAITDAVDRAAPRE
jgi:peptidoglycan hydrolase-like protein with peptidoglycan-binding domain